MVYLLCPNATGHLEELGWRRDRARNEFERFLVQERREMACEMEQLRELLPYRNAG